MLLAKDCCSGDFVLVLFGFNTSSLCFLEGSCPSGSAQSFSERSNLKKKKRKKEEKKKSPEPSGMLSLCYGLNEHCGVRLTNISMLKTSSEFHFQT